MLKKIRAQNLDPDLPIEKEVDVEEEEEEEEEDDDEGEGDEEKIEFLPGENGDVPIPNPEEIEKESNDPDLGKTED